MLTCRCGGVAISALRRRDNSRRRSAFSPAIPIGTQEVDVAPTLRDLPGTSFRDPDETVNDTIDLMLRER